jgi:hypothetical protein
VTRPILAVDVDGVVSLFDDSDSPDPERSSFHMVDGMVRCISQAAGEMLCRLSQRYELVWATGWEERANLLAPLLGIPECPYLTFGGKARFGTADWKLEPLAEYARGRPLAWIDDSFDESCHRWAREREEPTLLVRTEPHLGLQEEQVETLSAWALAPLPAGPPRTAD